MAPKNSITETMLKMAIIFFCLIGPAHTEIYRYQDEQGHWHFSDRPVMKNQDEVEESPAPAGVPDSRAGEPFRLQARNKNTNVVYSTLRLGIPDTALSVLPIDKIQSMGATPYDEFIGGFYSIFSPQNLVLKEPIAVSITCTPEALKLYRRLNPNAKSLNLTLAVWHQDVGKYQLIDSAFENGKSRVKGKLHRLGNGWNIIVVIEKSKAYTGEGLNLNSCENDTEAHGNCVVRFSGKMSDITICEKIRDETQKNECLQQIAQNNRAEAVCGEINDRLARQGCFKNIALAEGKPAICEMVSEDPSIIKAFCYQGLAEKLKEPTLCDQILPVLTMEAKAECVQRASSD